ncbi:MAG: SurA N-terminal domain-containing protein [Thermodesulfobacteriota bacterium]|nr:SurA N-terminal domain-containing protein [Thermodesulfobacteriota bacterium]
MFKKIVLTCLMLGLMSAPVAAKTLSKIAAVVNDDIITTRQLEQRLADTSGKLNRAVQQRQVLDVMISELLMQQRAQEIGLEVTDGDIEKAISDVEAQNNISRDQLEQALISQGLTMTRYRAQLTNQILRYKLMGREVQSKVDITRQEVRNYYQQHLDDYRQSPHTRLSRLSFPIGVDEAKAQADAEVAQRKLLAGQSVDEVLLELSPRTRIEGGDMGSFKAGELSATFEDALSDLDIGGISPIVRLGNVLHILKVEHRSSGGVADLASVEGPIRQQLRKKKMDEKLQQWREELKKEAYIDIRL